GLADDAIDAWIALHTRERFAGDYFRRADGAPWRVRDYQRASIESWARRKVHCDGRDVGKTTEIEVVACWAMVALPDTEMLIATQCENHLFPLMHRLQRRFKATPEFAPSLVEMKQSPSWFFRFSNGFLLWGRIAGPRGMNFQGLHVDWQIVDEAQEMTETAWGELYQALNGDGRRWVYGVPNGLRNTFHRMTRIHDAEQYNWPSSLNPEFTPEKEAELAALYGGRASPGYVHRVLGRHGEPAHAVFALDDYLACIRDDFDFVDAVAHEGDDFAPPADVPDGEYYLGCDLGFARDPSEIVVYRNAPPHLMNVLRLRLDGVNYAKQQAVIEALDRAYRFRLIGIDAGNSGRAVAHQLMARDESWCARVRAFEFGGATDAGVLPDGSRARRRVKELMTELIQRRMAERTVVFPPIADREQQYAAHTYYVGPDGRVVYEKGNDHLIDADRCAALCHYLDTQEDEAPSSLGIGLGVF
ncbi:MAG TPA: hypothetical protein PKI11_21270, partial [Candidatus Hydrogenedentes bacterium]|nr:hypothetical protein [Candidatus Hydrogenedentota bacterium]